MSVTIDFTDVTLVSEDTYQRLHWWDPDDSDEHDDHIDQNVFPENVFSENVFFFLKVYFLKVYLASQDALEVMRVTDLLTDWLSGR